MIVKKYPQEKEKNLMKKVSEFYYYYILTIKN